MKNVLALFFSIQLNVYSAGIDDTFFLVPHNPYIGQDVSVGIAFGLSCGIPLLTEHKNFLTKNIIVVGNRVKLLTYPDPGFICVPITPPGAFIYQIGDLALPAGTYILELHILQHDVPFPLPAGFVLNPLLEIPFEVLAPKSINSTSNISLLVLILLLSLVSFNVFRNNKA